MKGGRKRRRYRIKDDKFDVKYVKFLLLMTRHGFGILWDNGCPPCRNTLLEL